jgi:hypothetical protein
VFVWFAASAFWIVASVFNSPAIDYRLVMLGAVAPVAEIALGGPYLLHTLVGSVALLVVVVVGTRGRRLQGRQLVALPIGTFLHLVLDGTWAKGELFWWPARGAALGDGSVPEIAHWGLSLVLELAGVALAVAAYRRFGLTDRARLRRFVRSGRLDRTFFR